ncbi:MAG: FtsX-like permease family protein [Acidimicrobiia bacterium]
MSGSGSLGRSLRAIGARPVASASAALILLVAAVSVSVGPILSSAVGDAGLRAALAAAPVEAVGLRGSAPVRAASMDELSAAVTGVVSDGLPGATVSEIRQSAPFTWQDDPTPYDTTVIVAHEGIEGHAELVEGTWPGDVGPGETLPVALSEQAAAALGLVVGDSVGIEVSGGSHDRLTVSVAGIFRVVDAQDPFWWGELLETAGRRVTAEFVVTGPLVVSGRSFDDVVEGYGARQEWRVFPDFGSITSDDLGRVSDGMRSVDERLAALEVGVESDFPTLEADLRRKVEVSSAGINATSVQLSLMAGFAMWSAAASLMASLRRHYQTIELRGGTRRQMMIAGALQATLLGIPAVVAGPWLASWAVDALGRLPTFVEAGLILEAGLDATAYVFAGGAIAVAVALVALMASRIGSPAPDLLRRTRIDLVLAGIAVVAMAVLLFNPPRLASGGDPALLAVPAVALLLAPSVAARLVPAASAGTARLTSGTEAVPLWLGMRNFGSRAGRHTHSSILTVLAVAMLVFALAFDATWTNSQADRASHQVGSDALIIPERALETDPAPFGEGTGFAAAPGVSSVVPVTRRALSLASATDGGVVLGVGPGVADIGLVRGRPLGGILRADELGGAWAGLGVELGAPRRVAVVTDRPARVELVVRDFQGVLHVLSGAAGPALAPREWLEGAGALDEASTPLTVIGVVVDAPDARPEAVIVESDSGTVSLTLDWVALPGESDGVNTVTRYLASTPPVDAPIAVIVNETFASASVVGDGDHFQLVFAGLRREFEVVGVVELFPTGDPDDGIIVMDRAALATLEFAASGRVGGPDEWWASLDRGDPAAARSALLAAGAAEVTTRAGRLAELLGDPLPLGLLAASYLGAALAALLAAVIMATALASALEERRSEMIVMIMAGMSSRQLSTALAVEHGALLLFSGLAGGGLGVLLSYLLLGSVTLGSDGRQPVPAATVELPAIRALLVVAGIGLVLVVMLLAVVGRARTMRAAPARRGVEQW